MRSLLDAHVLIALFDESHVFNERAHTWLESRAEEGIATCPLTENALVRIPTLPSYSKTLQCTPREIIATLTDFVNAHDHRFWPDSLSLRSSSHFRPERIPGSRQLTDIYLLSLAVAHQGRLVTFDEKIPRSAVPNAEARHLVVI